LLLGVDHRGGVQLLHDGRAADLMARLEQLAAKNLRGENAVLLPEEYFALAGFGSFDLPSGDFSR
jgi:hypothetical protein